MFNDTQTYSHGGSCGRKRCAKSAEVKTRNVSPSHPTRVCGVSWAPQRGPGPKTASAFWAWNITSDDKKWFFVRTVTCFSCIIGYRTIVVACMSSIYLVRRGRKYHADQSHRILTHYFLPLGGAAISSLAPTMGYYATVHAKMVYAFRVLWKPKIADFVADEGHRAVSKKRARRKRRKYVEKI